MSEERDLFAFTHRLQSALIQVKNVMESFRQGDFSDFPDVGVCSRAELKGARSGYVIESNTIYVAEDFAAASSEAQIATVLLQEIFNAIEARVRYQAD